jgi:hypothetical protein
MEALQVSENGDVFEMMLEQFCNCYGDICKSLDILPGVC